MSSSNTDTFDANISDYTTSELMQMVNLTDSDLSNKDEIVKKTNDFMTTYPKVANFGQEIQNTMLQLSDQLANGTTANAPSNEKQTDDWYSNENQTQPSQTQNDKITDRAQKIDVYGNQHVPMSRQTLGVNNSYLLPVAQDVLNPNLRTSTQRIVNLDSQFRNASNTETATDYSCNLRDTIYRAYSMRLYSFQIPFTWYVIDTVYGNTCFWIVNNGTYIGVSVAPGNYDNATFFVVLNAAFATAGFTFTTSPVSYNVYNGKLTFNLYDGSFNGVDIYGDAASFTITEATQILFFDFTSTVTCGISCISKEHYLNQTLGWIMGFRTPYIYVDSSGNMASAVLDLSGPKYLLLSIDDYCQNHVNHGLVSIDQPDKHFKLPQYYTPNMPYFCVKPQISNLKAIVEDAVEDVLLNNDVNTANEGLIIGSKYENDYTPTQIVLPSAPRVLTQSQIYTINEINKINNNNTNYLSLSPSSPDILSLLPVKTKGLNIGDVIIEFSGSLQDNLRNYFGPVNIKRLGVKLLDDKGNVVNLNGADWNVTIIFDCLYQY